MAGPVRILVVDDNHLIRRLLDLLLEGAGYMPVLTDSGEAALEVMGEVLPDLCIVDEVMPGMAGSELVSALRRSGDARLEAMPVIGMSARADGARALVAAGATGFVAKPIDEDALLAAVADALRDRPRFAQDAAGAS